MPLTRLWAEPAGDLLAPLLDWLDPDFEKLIPPRRLSP